MSVDADGVCGAGSSKTGVKLENKADESLSLQIDLDLGDDDSKPSWSKTLLDFSQPLGSDCFPINIPGLGPSSTTSAAATIPTGTSGGSSSYGTCTPPGKSGICQKTSTPCSGGNYIAGYCPGDDSVKCCAESSASPTPTSSSSSYGTCTPPSGSGVCQKNTIACSGGAYVSGYCPGDDTIQVSCSVYSMTRQDVALSLLQPSKTTTSQNVRGTSVEFCALIIPFSATFKPEYRDFTLWDNA